MGSVKDGVRRPSFSRCRRRHQAVVADEEEGELRGRRRGGSPAEREQIVDPVVELEERERGRLP